MMRVILVLLCCGGLFFACVGSIFLWRFSRIDWRQAEGRMIRFELKPYSAVGSHGDFEVVCEYEYEVDGKRYTGHRVSSGRSLIGSTTLIKNKLGSLSPARVVVYYNAANPGACHLIRDSAVLQVVMLLVGLLVGLVAGWRFLVLK